MSADGGTGRLDPSRLAAAALIASVVPEAESELLLLTRLARDLVGAEVGLIALVDDQQELLRAVVGLPAPYVSGVTVPIELSLCARMVEDGQEQFVAALEDDVLLRDHPAVVDLGLRSWAGIPLRLGELVVGGFCVLSTTRREWSDADRRLLRDLAGTVGTELRLSAALQELAQARDAERRLAAEQSAFIRVATRVAAEQDEALVAAALADEVVALLGATSAQVLRFRPDGRSARVALAGGDPPEDESCAAVLAELRRSGAAARGEGADPCLAAPVAAQGRQWGALVATGATSPDVALAQLERFAGLLVLAVTNAEAQRRLVELTQTDSLTGVANRRAFVQRIEEELARAQRHGGSTTLAVADVDRFKQLNDEHGHVVGDRVLREFVARVAATLRTGDLLARLGGDEFALLLPHTDGAAAAKVVDRIRQAVAGAPLAGVPVTVTLGAAVLESGQAAPEELYRSADQALYAAKAAGRDTVRVQRLR
jgi:diguanylate cyclase (GGDEF)-like protein